MAVAWLLTGGAAAWCPAPRASPRSGATRLRASPARLLTPPYKLPYEVPPLPKAFSDYEWDESYPGTLKPGKRRENQNLDDVLEYWKDRENGNVMQLPRDQLWQVPLKPPEDILTWLSRIGLLDESEDEDVVDRPDSSLLDDEFDLDSALDGEDLGGEDATGTMSDFL